MEGQLFSDSHPPAAVSFHVLCFHMWDDERGRAPGSRIPAIDPEESAPEATTYSAYTIVTVATKQRAGGWGVTLRVLDIDGTSAMDPHDFGGGVTFDTKAIAHQAANVFARLWIDCRIGRRT